MAAPAHSLQHTIFRVAVLLSLALLWAIMAVAVLRSGLGDGGFFLFSTAVFGLACIWLPMFALPPEPSEGNPSFVVAALAMILGPVLPALGLALATVAPWVVAVIVAWIGWRSRKSVAQAFLAPGGLLPLFGGSLLLAAFFIVSGAPWRLFIPEAITLGIAQADSYFHVAIAQMFAWFRIPSTGGDGLALQHYHFGSHIVAAGLAEAAASKASLAYVYWGLILLKLQLLWALVWGSLVLARSTAAAAALFPLVAYAAVFLLLGPLESESFMLAMAVFAGAAPLMCSLFTRDDHATRSYRFGLLTILLAAFVCATAKVSVGYFCAAALGWLLWRGRGDRLNAMLLLLGLAALGAWTVLLVLPFEQSLAAAGIGILLGSYAQYASPLTLLSYALPCLVLWAYVRELRVTATRHSAAHDARTTLTLQYSRNGNGRGIVRRVISGDGLMQLHALCLVACVLVLVSVPIGSGMAYFSYLLLFLPALVAPTWLLDGYASAKEIRRAALIIAALSGLYLAVAFSTHLAHTVSALARSAQQQTAAALRDTVDGAGLGRRVIAKSLRQTASLFGYFRLQVEQTAWTGLLSHIRGQGTGAALQVFVPPSADEFWSRLRAGKKNPNWCLQAHLMIPAELGVPMIRGIAPLKHEADCAAIAGLYGFGKHQDRHRTADLSDPQLCEIARARRLDGVYVLNSIAAPAGNRLLRCT